MNRPHCASALTKEQTEKTALGYRTFSCSVCKQAFNERTGTPFNFLEYPTAIVLLVVLWRLRYKLSLRDRAEMFLERGWEFTHETIREWETRFVPFIAEQVQRKRCGQAGQSWYVDETYLKVRGKWWYLYRAIDADGNLVDSRLSEKRDRDAARRFFEQALAVVGHALQQVTTDGHPLGENVQHRTNKYLNNRLEQNHRGIKQRYYPMRGFGNFQSAARFCHAFDALRTYLRSRRSLGERVSLPQQRQVFREGLAALRAVLISAS